jgi:hypothetical protein
MINPGSLFLIIILQPFPPANAIFTGIAVLFSDPKISVISKFHRRSKTSTIATTHSSSFRLILESFENFLDRLRDYIGVPSTPALSNVLVKILTELLSTLALATKQVKQGRLSEFVLLVMTLD